MWHWGWGWWMGFGMVAFWLLVGVAIWFLARSSLPREHGAEEILADRFARGEISAEEYDERRRVLTKR